MGKILRLRETFSPYAIRWQVVFAGVRKLLAEVVLAYPHAKI